MKRKSFLTTTALATAGIIITKDLFGQSKGEIFGHNEMTFRINKNWGSLNPDKTPVNDCHEMIQDGRGRIILLTNETRNNIIVYDKKGGLIETWGHDFPGAHGLTVQHAGKEDLLFITDTVKHKVYKTDLKGNVILTIEAPKDISSYEKNELFVPTETAVLENGEFYIADGYGQQFILHFDEKGQLKNSFGGKGEGEKHFDNAHGICVDTRYESETLLITDRTRHAFKRFTLDGKYIETIHLPGACVCRPVIKGEYLYAAVLRSPSLKNVNSGFVTVLNKENRVVSNIGGSEPVYENNQLKPLHQTDKIFNHPHDVCVDDEGSLYVAQWSSGKVYPYKFTRT